MGLYQRPDSDVYWISYLDSRGRRQRESTRTSDKDTAQRILDDKKGKVARGDELLPRVDRVTYAEAREELLTYYRVHGTRDVGRGRGPARAPRPVLHRHQDPAHRAGGGGGVRRAPPEGRRRQRHDQPGAGDALQDAAAGPRARQAAAGAGDQEAA